MKTAIVLAFKNLIGAGMRTWINVLVLSFSFVVIVWIKGMMVGWDRQAKNEMVKWEIAEGQYWHKAYDPYDSFSWQDAHTLIPDEAKPMLAQGDLAAILITSASIYPEGRMLSVCLKGINASQTLLQLPTKDLMIGSSPVPVAIGKSMSHSARLEEGDLFTLRWRDKNGVFDATQAIVKTIFHTQVPAVDAGQVWVELAVLQEMLGLPNHATIITYGENQPLISNEAWIHRSFDWLVADLDQMIKTKSDGQSVFYLILLMLAMLAIFDTQVLSIFKRQKEIGTYVALGYTRKEVVLLFTLEGGMYAFLAAILGFIYGYPFLYWQSKTGFVMPVDTTDYGIAGSNIIYPQYTLLLVFGTILWVGLITSFVSYLPSRKIARMNPTEALRGKIQ